MRLVWTGQTRSTGLSIRSMRVSITFEFVLTNKTWRHCSYGGVSDLVWLGGCIVDTVFIRLLLFSNAWWIILLWYVLFFPLYITNIRIFLTINYSLKMAAWMTDTSLNQTFNYRRFTWEWFMPLFLCWIAQSCMLLSIRLVCNHHRSPPGRLTDLFFVFLPENHYFLPGKPKDPLICGNGSETG